MAETWPASLRPTRVGFALENPTRSGGVALNGMEQTVSSGAERWRASIALSIRNTQQVLDARVFFGRLLGRAGEALVPVFDGRRANWPLDARGRVLHPGITRRRPLDGTAFEDPEVPAASEVIATVNATAALRAVQMGINVTQGAPIREGQYFGLANRVHLITGIDSVVGSVTTVTFRPPLRAAAINGDVVVFTRPVCTMKFASDDQGQMVLDLLRFSDLGLEFVEAF